MKIALVGVSVMTPLGPRRDLRPGPSAVARLGTDEREYLQLPVELIPLLVRSYCESGLRALPCRYPDDLQRPQGRSTRLAHTPPAVEFSNGLVQCKTRPNGWVADLLPGGIISKQIGTQGDFYEACAVDTSYGRRSCGGIVWVSSRPISRT